jgi:hypothetical protein
VTVKKKDVLQGTLALLVLKTLASHRKLHGYITSHIHAISDDRLRVEEVPLPGASSDGAGRVAESRVGRDRRRTGTS